MRGSYLNTTTSCTLSISLLWNLAPHANSRRISNTTPHVRYSELKNRPHANKLENPLVSKRPFSYNLTEAGSEAEMQSYSK